MGVTGRMRVPRNFGWAVRRTRETLRDEGPRGFGRRAATYVRRRGLRATPPALRRPLPRGAVSTASWPTSVLMVAAPDPPQCYHYRVEQKVEACRELGVPFAVASPYDERELLSLVQLAGVVIVFRQAESPSLRRVVTAARRLGTPVVFEADDLVYRRDLVELNPNLQTVPADLRNAVIRGSDGYLGGLVLADHVLASTEVLAADMGGFVRGRAFVMTNGVDERMVRIAEGVANDPAPPRRDPGVLIGYGSGSRAHDLDLAVAAPALARLMATHPDVRLKLTGPLRVPDELTHYADRIEVAGLAEYGEYLRGLGSCDLTIAPLLDLPFNDYKSQVKYLEAALVGVPFVGSRIVYERYVRDGENGCLAGPSGWFEVLDRLVRQPGLRADLAAAAAKDLQQYLVPQLPARQLGEMLATLGGGR